MAENHDTLLIVGAVAVGLYMFKDQIKGLFSGVGETADAVGDVAGAAGDFITYNVSGALKGEKALIDLFKKGLTPTTNNYYYKTLNDNQVGATNSQGDIIGVKTGTLGLSVLNPKSTNSGSKNYGQSWLRVTPTNTQNITGGQTASQAIATAMNPYITNVAITSGNSTLINTKPVSLPPSLLSIVTGRY